MPPKPSTPPRQPKPTPLPSPKPTPLPSPKPTPPSPKPTPPSPPSPKPVHPSPKPTPQQQRCLAATSAHPATAAAESAASRLGWSWTWPSSTRPSKVSQQASAKENLGGRLKRIHLRVCQQEEHRWTSTYTTMANTRPPALSHQERQEQIPCNPVLQHADSYQPERLNRRRFPTITPRDHKG